MAFKLVQGVYLVRCHQPGCPFHGEVKLEANLMGQTQEDVEEEAKKLARDKGNTMHDAVYGTTHKLVNPEVRRLSGRILPIRTS